MENYLAFYAYVFCRKTEIFCATNKDKNRRSVIVSIRLIQKLLINHLLVMNGSPRNEVSFCMRKKKIERHSNKILNERERIVFESMHKFICSNKKNFII